MQYCSLFLSPNKTLWRGQNGGVRFEVIVSLERSQCVELIQKETFPAKEETILLLM